jgi:hypothetical protein
MKLFLHTTYELSGTDSDPEIKYHTHTFTEITPEMPIKAILDIHNEKVGAIERKLLK